jgi:hypothetical protein
VIPFVERDGRGLDATFLQRSSLFWDVTQHRLVVTDVSVKPIVPIIKVLAGHFTGSLRLRPP